jgi:hypothetical protein
MLHHYRLSLNTFNSQISSSPYKGLGIAGNATFGQNVTLIKISEKFRKPICHKIVELKNICFLSFLIVLSFQDNKVGIHDLLLPFSSYLMGLKSVQQGYMFAKVKS